MNLREFTELVDKQAEKLERQELLSLIHSIARIIPEDRRQDFLEIFNYIRRGIEQENRSTQSFVNCMDQTEIKKELERLNILFGQIRDEELYLQAQGYEDYSRGHWDSDWIWEYEDQDGIGKIYEDSARLILRCVNCGCYNEAVQLFDSMMETEVSVMNDWEDFNIDMEELRNEKLVSIDFENLALCVLYAVYQITEADERAEVLYDYFSISFFKEIKLERMFCIGREELEGLPQFWDAWIALLSESGGDLAARLLIEAIQYERGSAGMLQAARTAYKKHPSLYLEALKNPDICHDYLKQIEIGKEALEKIDKQYRYRSIIAIKTAEAAASVNEEDQMEICWGEAFVSHTTPVNYLRILNECRNPDICKYMTDHAIQRVQKGNNMAIYDNELKLNVVSENHIAILKFLAGDFDYAMDQCQKVKGALGWSGTFMKSGIALFLLLLYKEDEWKQGCLDMADRVISEMGFSAAEYYEGTKKQAEYRTAAAKDREVFHECFLKWKKNRCLSQTQEQKYMSCLEDLIDKRVKAIVTGQYRNHYRSVAALVAALGEVKESRGEMSGKQNMMMKYRAEFPRHSSFCGNLRGFGMKDVRKKGRN